MIPKFEGWGNWHSRFYIARANEHFDDEARNLGIGVGRLECVYATLEQPRVSGDDIVLRLSVNPDVCYVANMFYFDRSLKGTLVEQKIRENARKYWKSLTSLTKYLNSNEIKPWGSEEFFPEVLIPHRIQVDRIRFI